MANGPLNDLRVLEIGAIGPGAHVGMVLGDLGAEVVRVDRLDASSNPEIGLTGDVLRNRRSIALDLKATEDREVFLSLAAAADVVIEGFRPGVAERLGVGPEDCLAHNPAVVYGRITGWGRTGPLADRAGHDLNYLAISGALSSFGEAGRPPVPPLNLVADYGGGSMVLTIGVLAAVMNAQRTGVGQVVDASILTGVTMLSELIWSMRRRGLWSDEPQTNLIDGGAPHYRSYECSDGRYLSVAPIEKKFYDLFIDGIGLSNEEIPDRDDPTNWPALRGLFAEVILTRTRDEWASLFEGTDACVAPVLTWSEAAEHPQMRAVSALYETGSGVDASPAPDFSVSTLSKPFPPRQLDADREMILESWLSPRPKQNKEDMR